MKVLHAAYSSDPAAGVARQMAAEQQAADRLGIDWTARFFVPGGTQGSVCVQAEAAPRNRFAFKREYYRWLERSMRDHDVLVLRYLRYDPMQLAFIARSAHPVLLVHHTLEGPQIVEEGGKTVRVKHWLDDLLVRRCHARAAGLIAVTAEIAEYERGRGARPPLTLLYPNGITYASLPDEPLPAAPDGRGDDAASAPQQAPEFVFVASRFVEWHGLDLLIEAARRSQERFTVHIVGQLVAGQGEMLAEDNRFVVHGSLPLADLEALAARCTLGLGSFALHRKDMHQGCTLKVREYLLAGLPVYAGHADVFDASFRWYRHAECDIEPMLRFARECAGISRRRVAEDARPWIDKEHLLTSLHGSLLEHVAGRGEGRAA